jgi:MFS family permease
MAGGFAGTFVIGPLLERGMSWQSVWLFLGISGLLIGVVLFVSTPAVKAQATAGGVLRSFISPYRVVFRNSQSYLCGIISGLLFAPTTIGAMTWGVSFFQKDRGLTYHNAVTTASLITMGWVVGCPVLGWFSDRLGRRKPVLLIGIIAMICMMLQMIFLPAILPVSISCFLFGFGSGAAMIPYSIIKEVNPDEVKGSATGGMNFMTFGVSALIGPVFGKLFGPGFLHPTNPLQHFQTSLWFWIGGSLIALLAAITLPETGKTHGLM